MRSRIKRTKNTTSLNSSTLSRRSGNSRNTQSNRGANIQHNLLTSNKSMFNNSRSMFNNSRSMFYNSRSMFNDKTINHNGLNRSNMQAGPNNRSMLSNSSARATKRSILNNQDKASSNMHSSSTGCTTIKLNMRNINSP
ncbi:MAG: hypothetical protein ACRD2S_00270, partial [Terriglobales bacterium]